MPDGPPAPFPYGKHVMQPNMNTPRSLSEWLYLLQVRKLWLLGVIFICSVFSLLAALLYRPNWQASQAMLIRDVAIASISVPGRFTDADSRKAAQETVVELAHSPSVVTAALKKIGPDSRRSTADWPSQRDVEAISALIDIRAPQGAEFGSTEMFYLLVQQPSQSRAVQLTHALSDELERHLQDLRTRKARGTVEESMRSVRLAQDALKLSTEELRKFEVSVGQDVMELKSLTNNGSSEGNLQRNLNEVKNELRKAQQQHETNQQLLAILQATLPHPERILGTPNELLESQPALRRLKDGLVDAQLLSARLSGELSDVHPRVHAARAAEREIRSDLAREVTTAINSLGGALELSRNRVASLEAQRDGIEQRLASIVPLRAEYKNRLDEVERRNQILQSAEKGLSEAQSDQAAAQAASLITRWGDPITGSAPVGMGRTSLLLLGCLAGCVLALGIVVLVPLPAEPVHEGKLSVAADAWIPKNWWEHPSVAAIRGTVSQVLSRNA